jgi:hypothetical protein
MTLELRCPKHPKYDGKERPRTQACSDCWELFRIRHENQTSLFGRKS